MNLDRLRELAREPDRTAMPKGPLPSMTDQVFALKQENMALRRGLNEAIAEIEARPSLAYVGTLQNPMLTDGHRALYVIESDQ